MSFIVWCDIRLEASSLSNIWGPECPPHSWGPRLVWSRCVGWSKDYPPRNSMCKALWARKGWPRQGESWCSKPKLLPISQKQAGSTTIDQLYMAPTGYTDRHRQTDRAHTTSKLNTAHHLEAPRISTCETLLHRKDVVFKGMKKYFGKTSTSLPGPG